MSFPSRSACLSTLALACASLPGPVLAQQTAAPFADVPRGAEAAVTLSELSVSATGVPTPVDQVGSSVTVLTAATLEAQQRRTVPDDGAHIRAPWRDRAPAGVRGSEPG